MKISVIVFLLRIFIYADGESSIEFASFRRNSYHDNRVPVRGILEETSDSQSLSHCISVCSKRPDCNSFFYNLGTEHCVCTRNVSENDLMSSTGYLHFTSNKGNLDFKKKLHAEEEFLCVLVFTV